MADFENIPNAEADDRQINRDDFNRVIDVVNKYGHTFLDPSSVDYITEDGTINNSLPRNTRIADFPFRVEVLDSDDSVLSIVKGDWVRDQTAVTLEAESGNSVTDYADDSTKLLISTDTFKNAGAADLTADTDYYVYVHLQANTTATTLDFDPALIPGKLILGVDRDRETAEARTPSEAYTLIAGGTATVRDFWVKDKEIVATVQLFDDGGGNFHIKEIKQKVSTDIEDFMVVPDTANKVSVDDAGQAIPSHSRYTIEVNKVADGDYAGGTIHFGEYQLNNVDQCPGEDSRSMPYFESWETNNSLIGPSGALNWATIDSYYQPEGSTSLFKTIDIVEDANTDNNSAGNVFEMVVLRNVLNSNASSKSMTYYDASVDDGYGQATGELQWAGIDTHLDGCDQKSLEVQTVDGTARFQIYDFEEPTTQTSTQGLDWGLAANYYTLLARQEGASLAEATVKYLSPVTQDVVTDVNYNTSTGVLKQTKTTLTIFSVGSSSDSTITTAVDCD